MHRWMDPAAIVFPQFLFSWEFLFSWTTQFSLLAVNHKLTPIGVAPP